MKKYLVLLAAALLQAGAWAATYTFTGPTYSTANITNFTSCPGGSGDCGAYTTAMSQEGWLTIAAPLPGNLNGEDITALVTAFSFSDGLTTYASNDPEVGLANVAATTTGGVLEISLVLQRWQMPAPHVAGDHFDAMAVMNFGGSHNALCTALSNTQGNAYCATASAGNVYSSWLASAPGGVWTATGLPPVAFTAVPTLGEWGLLLLASLMLGAGWMAVGRRRM
jgi:hypothetical protein